jgi:hypothetical protein
MASSPLVRLAAHASVLVSLLGVAAFAQETRSAIFGAVTDPSSAAVAGTKVFVVNQQTNVEVSLITNETGYYQAPLLVAGSYRVRVEAGGFKTSLKNDIDLPVGSRLEVNVTLEVGALSDTVSVSAEAPLLNTDTMSSGGVVESKSMLDLPIPAGNALTLAKLAPGIQTTDSLSDKTVRLHSNGAASRYYAWGGVGASLAGAGGNDWYIDGASNYANGGTSYMPAPELMQEFKLETSGFDASFGHGVGVTVQMMTRNGTNQFHGNVRETHHQFRWDALDFFTKKTFYTQIANYVAAGNTAAADALRAQGGQAPGRENYWAAALGGPVLIPKVINGRNKLFFFLGYSGFRVGQYRQSYNAVPSAAMRQGDFAALLKVNATLYQVYDPYSTTPDPTRSGHVVRTPFPGNIVPQSRIINPIYKFYNDLLPLPNTPPADPTVQPSQNYTAYSSPYQENYYQYANRFDYNPTEKDRIFFRWNLSEWRNSTPNWLYLSGIPGILTTQSVRHNAGQGLDWVHTFSPTMLLDLSVANNIYRNQGLDPGFQALKPSSVGLPTYMDVQASSSQAIPNVTWSGWTGVTASNSVFRDRAFSGKAELTRTMGPHTLKLGFDARAQYYTGYTPGNNAGSFGFDSTYTQRTEDGLGSAGTGGFAGSWAAFMMGLPTTNSIDINASQALLNPYYAAYAQENWRVNRKLSLNFGLRMEYELGPTERYNRMLGTINPSLSLPITSAAQAAYAANPIPQLPVSQFNPVGGPSYVGVGGVGRKLWDNKLQWEPRIAAAYAFNPKTVLRFGTGIFYDTLNVMNLTGSGVSTPINQTGFSQTTTTTITNDFGQTWAVGNPPAGVSPLTDPFPLMSNGARFLQPLGSALGAMAAVGRGYTFWPFDRPHIQQFRWRLDVQREIGRSMALDVAYGGSYSQNVTMSQSLSALPAQYWSYGTTRNDAVATAMNANVTNPYYIGNFSSIQKSDPTLYNYMSNASFFTSKTIAVNKLLSPFSQMNGLTEQAPVGKAKTEELDVSFQRRFSNGMNFNLAYTRMWLYAADYFPNAFATSPAWEPGNLGVPHRLTANTVYQVPVGKGRRWLPHGPASWILGGYQFTAIYEFQPGSLITWSTTTFYNGDPQSVCNGPHTFSQWFNTSGFVTAAAAQATSFQAAVFPREINGYGGCRADKLSNWNLDAQRDFRLHEKTTLSFRFDVYNVQNRSQMSAPVTSPTNTFFGQVTSQPALTGAGGGAINRWVTVQAHLSF